MDAESAQAKSKRHRSPPYPFYSLKHCVRLIKKLHKEDGLAIVPKELALKHMDLDITKMSANRALSSLKNFNLLEEKGPQKRRVVRLSDLAKRIILLRDESPEQIAALQSAALSYDIIRDLREQWPNGLPADDVIVTVLLVDKNFNERAAKRFAQILQTTYEFAKLGGNDILSESQDEPDEYEDTTGEIEDEVNGDVVVDYNNQSQSTHPKMRQSPIPLIGGGQAIFTAPIPLSSRNYEHILKWFELMKPALVDDSETDRTQNNGEQEF